MAARRASIAAAGWAASAVAAEAAQYAMEVLGVPEEYRYFIGLGLDAYQIFANIKALRALAKLRGPSCFVAGTQVVTGQNPDGTLSTRSIEDLKVGDLVLARDQNDAADGLDLRRVTQVFVKTSDHVRALMIEGDGGNVETIQTTDEHPFYVRDRGWVEAGDLLIGDLVQESDGTWQTVLSSVRETHDAGITVYNFEVEGDHTYFVEDGVGAKDAVWVHNLCVGGKFVARIKTRGVEIPFGLEAKSQKFKLRPKAENDLLQQASGPHKKQFVIDVADDPSIRETLLKNGVKKNDIDDVIKDMKKGTLPDLWDVHHVKPTKWGGDNSSSNFIIVKRDPWHTALSSEQNTLTNEKLKLGVQDNDEFEVDWVVFPEGSKIFAG